VKNRLLLVLYFILLVGCESSPPLDDYSLASIAIVEARRCDAGRFATGFMHRAEEAYRLGQQSYKKGDFVAAQNYFVHARLNAEKAENKARLARTGEGF
jgi:hypothetical protein